MWKGSVGVTERLDFDYPRFANYKHVALTFGSLGLVFGLIFGLSMSAPECAAPVTEPSGRLVQP